MLFTFRSKKKIKQLSLLFILLLFNLPSYAQKGCIIVYSTTSFGNRVYTKSLGTFTECNGYSNVEQFDPNVYTDFSATCTVTPNPLGLVISSNYRNCIVSSSCGVKETFVVDNCPIDSYIIVLLLLITGVACYFIRKNRPAVLS
ncbi:hypothetical protein VRU48_06985 [Pedobacter sp. KR3-3]|uniref:Uncharacterized protein n=1 Tax=Pedobacter albus TaxID=3113905 RepID=A0ABU7I5X5_9SPHI|nr:hypothetical protein [Pedobacter sp. KR3-3]MEE1944843.1 hypothetical protein [Pedobacter sp. KR3-3]